MTSNEARALQIVMELRSAPQSIRDEWKEQALEMLPDCKAFILQAYKIASEG